MLRVFTVLCLSLLLGFLLYLWLFPHAAIVLFHI